MKALRIASRCVLWPVALLALGFVCAVYFGFDLIFRALNWAHGEDA